MSKPIFVAAGLLAVAMPARGQNLAANDINQMSIEQLANVSISSASKTSEPLRNFFLETRLRF